MPASTANPRNNTGNAHEKQQQAVRDNHAEHRAREERQIREETGEILVVSHVADAEDKNAQADQ